jgi:hypothetical protein
MAIFAFFFAGGCSAASPGTVPAAPPPDAGANDSGYGVNDSGYGAPAPDAASCPSVAPAACNAITNVGAPVTVNCTTVAPPAMTGGPIVDGTYVLAAETLYTGVCGDLVQTQTIPAETLVIAGSCAQVVSGSGADAGHSTIALASTGIDLTLGGVCPGTAQGTYAYTASNSTLTLLALDPTGTAAVSIYARQ